MSLLCRTAENLYWMGRYLQRAKSTARLIEATQRLALQSRGEEAADVAVVGVAPELPVVVGADHAAVEPHGAGRGLPHLRAARRREQRQRQAEGLAPLESAHEVDAADDVEPLVLPAHLQRIAGGWEVGGARVAGDVNHAGAVHRDCVGDVGQITAHVGAEP